MIEEIFDHGPRDTAWIMDARSHLNQTKMSNEISFNRYFYQRKSLRPLDEVTADLLRLESEEVLKNRVNFGEIN